MEKKAFKKYFISQVQDLLKKYDSPDLSIEYSGDILIFKLSGETVGRIEFKFLTGKQLPAGAIASIFVAAEISGGEVWNEILKNDSLKKKNTNPYTNHLFYFYSSSSRSYLFKGAKTDFFPSDNIEDKTGKFLAFIAEELLSKISNILAKKMQAVDDILNTPNYYGQPEISILLLCKNNAEDQLPSSIEKDKRFLSSADINKKIWESNKHVIFTQ